MNSRISNFISGMLMGVAIGSTIGMISQPRTMHKLKKTATRACRSMAGTISNIM